MGLEEQNCHCPACERMVPPEAECCPECGTRYCPKQRNFLSWYLRSWLLWRTTTGRATPQEFYVFFLPNTLLLVWWWLEVWRADEWSYLFVWGLGIYHLLAIVPFCCLLTRRLHDRDNTWGDLTDEISAKMDDFCHGLTYLEPVVWLFVSVCVLIKEVGYDTIPGPNRFGPSIRYPRYNSPGS